MKTAVVILNWNTRDYLDRFLPPLIQSCEGLDAEVIVADSASTDGSMDLVKERFPRIRRIELDANYGFTGGYNKALAQVDAEYFVLINSDIEVDGGWLSPLVEWLDSHPECAACAPKLLSWHDRGRFEYAGAAGGCIDALGYPFCRGRVLKRTEQDLGQYDTPGDVFWVSGACMMIRASLWRECGGLDDRFFAHMEEIDLCWRLHLLGYSVSTVPQSKVFHIGGGTLPASSPRKLQLNYRNNLLMLDNNLYGHFLAEGHSPAVARCRATLRICLRYLLDDCSAVVYLLCGKVQSAAAVMRGHRGFWRLRQGRKDKCRKERRTAAASNGLPAHTGSRASVCKPAQPAGPRMRYASAGYYRGSILLAAAIHRDRIFDYIARKMSADSHGALTGMQDR